MFIRWLNLMSKCWIYFLVMIQQPQNIPNILWLTIVKRAHLSTLLKMYQYKLWMKNAAINTVIDIGANTGQFASAIGAILPEAQIYSFEPLPDCYQKLAKRLANHKRFKSFCIALGDEKKKINFWKSNFSPSSSVLSMTPLHKETFPFSAQNKLVPIQMGLLDDYLQEITLTSKTLLKIDVQGYEYKVLQGAIKILDSIDYILIEVSFQTLYEQQASFHDIYCYLISKGFEYSGSLGSITLRSGIALQEDILFIRKK